MNPRYVKGIGFALCYLLSIVLAAYLVRFGGIVPVGFGLVTTAGAYVIGITMVMRDLTQDQIGPKWAYVALLVGTLLSALISPEVAVASALAFLVSETLDQLVYTPLRRKSIILAVSVSNLVGIAADTLIFLQIVFGGQDMFLGQAWAKTISTVGVVVVLKLIYRNRTDVTPAYLLAKREKATKVHEGVPA